MFVFVCVRFRKVNLASSAMIVRRSKHMPRKGTRWAMGCVPHSNDLTTISATMHLAISVLTDNPATDDPVRRCCRLQELPQYMSNAVPVKYFYPFDKPALSQA